jgi:hypothetical protein
MSYKITGVSPDPENTVTISTTTDTLEKAARIAQDWSDHGVRNTVITDIHGRRFDPPAFKKAVGLTSP